jgi:TFIIF-interacting CTD phosphatase-like protein
VNKNSNSININNNTKEFDYPQHKLKKNKTNINFGYFSPYKKEKLSFKTPDKIYLKSPMRAIKREMKNKIEIPYIKTPSDKKYTLVLDLNKTLACYSKENIYLRNGLLSFLSMIKPYYELISFSCEPNDISENIIKEIESQKKYFDYNFTRQHSILYENTLVKDISLIGRDLSKIIIVDDDENCFKLNKENGIKIGVYNGNNENDNVLFELKKILILIYKKNYEDVRIALKEFSNDIKNKVSLD